MCKEKSGINEETLVQWKKQENSNKCILIEYFTIVIEQYVTLGPIALKCPHPCIGWQHL
jgi:hypothetical protein